MNLKMAKAFDVITGTDAIAPPFNLDFATILGLRYGRKRRNLMSAHD